MKFSPFKIFIVFLILTVLGAFIVPKLSVRLNPSKSLPSLSVVFSLPNAPAYILERDVTSVLEAGFSTLKGLRELRSKSSEGNGHITLGFDKEIALETARFRVATVVRQLYPRLPNNTSYPVIITSNPENKEASAFLSYAVHAPQTPFEIQKTVKTQIEPVIGAFEKVAKTRVHGATEKEVELTYDNQILKTLGILPNDIIAALERQFDRFSLGEVFYKGNFTSISVQPKDEILDWHFPVKKTGDRIVYLDDIVSVKKQAQEPQNYYRVNGKNAITLSVFAGNNANTIALAKKIDEKLRQLETKLPQKYEIVKTYDSTEYLKEELDKIYQRSMYTVIILLLFILLVSRSFRYLLVTVLSLLANLGIAFLLYFALGVEIQLYSLAGITISLGLILDNSIVMIDHIKNQGNQKVFLPILASTLTTIGALSVIYFLDEQYRLILIDFALVIIINLGVSLFIALFLIPALLKKIPLPKKKPKTWGRNAKAGFYKIYGRVVRLLLRQKKLAILFIILAFGIPIFMLPQKLEPNETWYQKTYNTTLGNEWYRENVRPYLDKYLGGSLRLFSYYVFENAYYGRNEETKLYVIASMEKGATVHQMNRAFVQLENYLLQYEKIDQFTTRVYSGDYARMEITFTEKSRETAFPFLLKGRLIRKALDLGGIDWSIYGVGNGFSNSAYGQPINFAVLGKGYNYDELNAWADTLKTALMVHPRIQEVTIRGNSRWRPEPAYRYTFKLDKEKLALAGVSPLEILRNLNKMSLSKYPDLFLNIQGDYLPVRLAPENATQFDIWDIKNTPLGKLENPITLKDMAVISKEKEEESIYKENQEYIRRVEFQYIGTAKFGEKFLEEQLKILETKLPLGYTFERSTFSFFQDEENNYFFLLLLVLGIVYFICAILFESLKQPFIILGVVPISFIGVFLTFYLFDFNFDQGGMASFVLLSGITVNASIYILNDFNGLKKNRDDVDNFNLYIQAFKQKIFPIVLTIISTLLGFVPFVIGGQDEVFWFALAVGTIGGLLFSLLGVLFYLPVFVLKKS